MVAHSPMASSDIACLLISVDVPHYVVGETNDLVSCPPGHLGKAFCLSLVLKGVAREVDAYYGGGLS